MRTVVCHKKIEKGTMNKHQLNKGQLLQQLNPTATHAVGVRDHEHTRAHLRDSSVRLRRTKTTPALASCSECSDELRDPDSESDSGSDSPGWPG